MVRLDDAIWAPGPTGAVGPPGWLGSAVSDDLRTFYAPLHDYQLTPPDLAPEMSARIRTITGRAAILAGTSIASYTNILSSEKSRFFANDDWVAVVGQILASDAVITLHNPYFFDRRLATFAFWWATAEGREDVELGNAVAFTSAYELATRGYVGLITSTDDPAVIEQYTTTQPLVRSPIDMLTDLGLDDMIAP